MVEFTLTSASATMIFVIACVAGFQYRRVWKAEGPVWQLWLYGLVSGISLLTLGFIPLAT